LHVFAGFSLFSIVFVIFAWFWLMQVASCLFLLDIPRVCVFLLVIVVFYWFLSSFLPVFSRFTLFFWFLLVFSGS